jgi:DNA-binding transcriptional regulator YiaG
MGASSMTDAEQVRKMRLGAGLTQDQLAQLLGYNLSAVHRWESGKHKVPPGIIELLNYKLLHKKH